MAMFLLGAGALGALLLLLSITLVNLWGYSQLEAALALMPIGGCGIIAVADRRQRRRPPRAPTALAMPALLSMAPRDAVVLVPAVDLRGPARLPRGAARDPPLLGPRRRDRVPGDQRRRDGRRGRPRGPGVASGVINTSRQLGAAVGIATLIATFSTTLAVARPVRARRRRRRPRPGVPDPGAHLRSDDAPRPGGLRPAARRDRARPQRRLRRGGLPPHGRRRPQLVRHGPSAPRCC